MSDQIHTTIKDPNRQKDHQPREFDTLKRRIHEHGFTIVELLVAVSLSIMLMLTITAMFMTFLLSNARTNINKSIASEGNYAVSTMEFLLRNATSIEESASGTVCEEGMDAIAFSSRDGGVTELALVEDSGDGVEKIASVSSSLTSFLTTKDVTIENGPVFDCTRTTDSTFVEAEFTLRKTATEGSDLLQTFTTIVTVRNI